MSLIDKTVRVRRGGSILTIPATAVDKYMAKGYSVIDSNGNILKASVPNDIPTLKAAYSRHLAEIKALKEEIMQLKEQLAKKEVVKEEVPAESVPEEEVPTEPTPVVPRKKSKKSE